MSDLTTITRLLDKDCFCHYSELNYMFECMPSFIKTPNIEENCRCYHDKSDQIREALGKFKTFIETKSLFKVGDRVELAYTPKINSTEAWGWMSSRHFLIEGAQAIVNEVSYYSNKFVYSVIFDNDNSWIDEKGVIHPNQDQNYRHTYAFAEDKLRPIMVSRCHFLKTLWNNYFKIGD